MANRLFLSFKVIGEAQPAGSKVSYVLYDKFRNPYYKGAPGCKSCHGATSVNRCQTCVMKSRIVVRTTDDCKKSDGWKATVHKCAKLEMMQKGLRTLSGVPLYVVCRIYQTRPKNQYRTGKYSDVLRDDAPLRPLIRPDASKFFRAIEDAMTNVVYIDDSIIVDQRVSKWFGKLDCVEIEIWIIE